MKKILSSGTQRDTISMKSLAVAGSVATKPMRFLRFAPRSPRGTAALVLSLAVLIICSSAISPTAASALTPQELFRVLEGKVLVLDMLDEKGKQLSTHTALLLDGKKAVTQCDLLAGAASLLLRHGNKAYPATILQKDSARNLCLLNVTESSGGVQLREADPAAGTRVYAVSNALGLGISISEGLVSGIRETDGVTAIQFTAPIAPGSEGGGLFDEEGRLVGVINYRQRDGQNVNFALPARWLKEIGLRAIATDDSEAWRNKADELAKEGKWRELEELATHWSDALPDSWEARYRLAYSQEQLKKWPAAAKNYRELFRRDPASSVAGIGLAGALLVQGKYQEALEAALATQTFRREDASAWILIAYAEEMLGNTVAAKGAMEKAVQLEPWNRQAINGMVTMGRRHKEWGMAIAAQSRLVEFEPGDVAVRIDLVELLLAGGRTRRALTTVEKALELAPAHGDAWLFKGLALSGLGRYREGTEAIRKGLGLKPARSGLGWGWLGDIYAGLKLYPEAIAAYREALLLVADNPSLRGQLGIALKDSFRLPEALELFEKLREETPADPFPWRQVCYVNSYLAQAEKAIPACEQSLKLDTRQPKVWAALMEAYQFAGRMDDAKRSLQKLQSVDQTWADYAYKRVLLSYEVTP